MLKKFRNNIKVRFKVDYKLQILVVSIFAFALLLLCAGFTVRTVSDYTDNAVKNYALGQENLVSQVAQTVKNSLVFAASEEGYSTQDALDTVAKNIIKNAETSGSKYWFLYSSDGVIFEKNDEETAIVKGKNILELIQYWKMRGGNETDSFEEMINQQQSGSSVFTKDARTGAEIVSLKCFTTGEKTYFLGAATQKSYVMSVTGVNAHVLYLYTFTAIMVLNFMILVLVFCLLIYKRQKENEKNSKSQIDKNIKIEELTRKLSSKTEAVQNASIYDSLTKLYNRKFFDNLLVKIKNELLLPVSILTMDINGLGKLNVDAGYGAGDELLLKTSDILHRVCIDTDVVARTGSSEFTVLMTGTKESEAYSATESIMRQFVSLDNAEYTLSIGVAEMLANENNIFAVLETARKNLTLNKMLDKNSNASSTVTMLMEALNAYSAMTVAHSDRLRAMAMDFGKALGMTSSELSRLAVAAQLHDVGKIGIPDSILNKKGKLLQEEKDRIRMHTVLGYKIVGSVPALDEVAIDILQHHEYYDGTGYPNGLKGEEISLNARIINIIDSFDAMTNTSVYAATKTVEEAIHELRLKSYCQYDPHLVNEFIRQIANNLMEDSEIEQWIS